MCQPIGWEVALMLDAEIDLNFRTLPSQAMKRVRFTSLGKAIFYSRWGSFLFSKRPQQYHCKKWSWVLHRADQCFIQWGDRSISFCSRTSLNYLYSPFFRQRRSVAKARRVWRILSNPVTQGDLPATSLDEKLTFTWEKPILFLRVLTLKA